MRALWIRVLLLAVFFNTAIGVPLHAATHLHAGAGHEHRQGPAHSHGAVGCDEQADCHGHLHEAEDGAKDGAKGGASEAADEPAPHGAHGSCTWCSSHAQLATALLAPAGLALPAADQPRLRPRAPAEAGPAEPLRWRYAARAPPPAH